MRKKIIYPGILMMLFITSIQPVYAAGSPSASSSLLSNPLALTLLILMALLLLIIGLLANLLLGTADYKLSKEKKENNSSVGAGTLTIVFLFISSGLFAQDQKVVPAAASTIGGMSATSFYVMTSVLFLELFVILTLLINIRMLLHTQKQKQEPVLKKKLSFDWWNRINRFRPVQQEADIDLGHDYDGIRELDNRLPPWWLYGFYISIVIAGIYLWRFHVSHTGPSSQQEFEYSVAKAEVQIKEYLKLKGESVDENTVTLLTAADDIAEGKKIFITSCASCHKATGAGDVGPNLTDDYWLHGGDIKSVFKTIRYGINAMPQWQNSYSNKQIAQVTSFIKTLHGTNPQNPKPPQGELIKEERSAASPDSLSNTATKIAGSN